MCCKAYDREAACHSVNGPEYHDSRKDVLPKGIVEIGDKERDSEHSDAVEEVKHSVCKVEPGQAKQFEGAQRQAADVAGHEEPVDKYQPCHDWKVRHQPVDPTTDPAAQTAGRIDQNGADTLPVGKPACKQAPQNVGHSQH